MAAHGSSQRCACEQRSSCHAHAHLPQAAHPAGVLREIFTQQQVRTPLVLCHTPTLNMTGVSRGALGKGGGGGGAQGFSLPTGSANQTVGFCVCVFVGAQVQSEPDDSTLVPALRMNKRPRTLNVRTRCTPTGVWENCALTRKISALFKHSAAAIVSAFNSRLSASSLLAISGESSILMG
jgi:hypothetical protein